MGWPLSQDYNEAIQDPRQSFSDPELKAGEAVTNALGIPLPRSGNFADVYELRCPSGSRWAVKCFTRQVEGLAERYAVISKFLRQVQLPFMVDFQYLEQGIRVRGSWYPILKMQWVEGFVLNDFVRDNLERKSVLQALGQIWLRMGRRLHEVGMAHCDLQHGNVLFVPGSTGSSLAVKLIDYDGMYVPALAGRKTGEVGHPAYQHPDRLRTGAYRPEVDRFPLLAVATALRCLAIAGRDLWDRYDNGDNLLFRQADLQSPASSPLFAELRRLPDPQARALVEQLAQATHMPLEQVPLLGAPAEEKPAARTAPSPVPPGRTAAATSEKPSTRLTGAPLSSLRRALPVPAPAEDTLDVLEEVEERIVRKKKKKKKAREGLPGWVWGLVGAAAAVLLLGVGIGVGLALRGSSTGKGDASQASQSRADQSIANLQPAAAAQNAPNPDPPPPQAVAAPIPGPLLVMNFEQDSFYQKDGKTYVRNLAGTGNDGLCNNVAFTPNGRAGGGLACNGGSLRLDRSLIRDLPSYTLTAWVRLERIDGFNSWLYARTVENFTGIGYMLRLEPSWRLGLFTVNHHGPPGSPDPQVLQGAPLQQNNWCFVAAVLRNGGISKGTVRLFQDNRFNDFSSQASWDNMTDATDHLAVKFHGILDEVTLIPRALSDAEIMALRRQGMEGKPLTTTPAGALQLQSFPPDREADTAIALNPLPPPEPDPGPGEPVTWGTPIDPDKDCKVRMIGDRLNIALPATYHDLGNNGRTNAPRVMREIEGDFTFEVRVKANVEPGNIKNEGPSQFCFLAAGMLLWIDDRNYLRLERAGLPGRPYVNWQQVADNTIIDLPHNFPHQANPETFLRLQRRGRKVFSSFSADGQNWAPLGNGPLDIAMPAKIKIGVAAYSSSARPFDAFFDRFFVREDRDQPDPAEFRPGPAQPGALQPLPVTPGQPKGP